MEKFIKHSGTATPLRVSNVDTDQVIPSVYLKRVTRTGFEDALFADWRKEPEFVLNKPEFAGSSVLIAGTNFGIGSSREHAVWALMDYGFKVVISSRFADIFRGNSGKAGLLTAQMEQQAVEELWNLVEQDPATIVTVDLEAREVRAGTLVAPFQIDDNTRRRLLAGLDDIAATLTHLPEIRAYEGSRPVWKPAIH